MHDRESIPFVFSRRQPSPPILTRKACSFHRRVTLSHFSGVVRITSADARSFNDTEPLEAPEVESLVSSASRIPSGANLAVQSSKVC